MKKIYCLIVMLLLCAASLFAQAPEKFNYQAVVRNANNVLVTNAPVGVRVSILKESASGNAVYVETHTVSTNANGLLTLEIGDGTVMEGSFSHIDWINGPFFLKTEIDPTGGSNYTVTSTQQLLSVPYALYAEAAGNGFSGNYNDLTNKPTIPQNVGDLINNAGYITANDIPAQVNADWDATGGPAEILNKPTNADFGQGIVRTKVSNAAGATDIAVTFSGYELVSGGVVSLAFTRAVPENATLNINNKGAKPIYYHGSALPTGTIKANDRCLFMYDGTGDRYYLIAIDRWGVDLDALATVAYSGSYNDLTDRPTIPTVPTNISAFVNDAGYITAIPDSFGGISLESDPIFSAWNKDYNDLINKPTNADFGQGIVRTKVNNAAGATDIAVTFSGYQLVNGGVVSLAFTRAVPESATLNINNKGAKPIYYHGSALPAGTIKANDRCLFMYDGNGGRYYLIAIDRWGVDLDALATVAFSGSYNDLTDRPTNISAFVNDVGYLTAIPDSFGGINLETDPIFSAWNKDYNDLINKPTNATFGQGIVRTKVNNAAGATDIAVTFSGYQLVNGGVVSLAFTRAVPDSATLNINNKGAKPIYYHGSALPAGTIKANDRCLFMYDGNGERYYLIAIDRWGVDLDALATVAYTGNYNDLTNKPNLAPVATSGNYNDLTNKPTIPTVPTNISAFVNDAGYLTAIPDSFGGINLETDPIFTAWNKDYNDLINKPTNATFGQGIVRSKVNNPAGETDITVSFSGYQLVNGGVVSLSFNRAVPEGATLNINNKGAKPIYYHGSALPAGTIKANDRCLFMYDGSGDRYYLIAIDRWGADIDALAAVAYSGSYNDLTDKPTIPTELGQLTNNMGYITLSDIPAHVNADWDATSGDAQILNKPNLAPVATSGNYNDLTQKPTNADFGQGIVRSKVSNPAGATDITVSFSGYQLMNGGLVSISFTRSVPENATLNINNKGAKPIYYYGSALPAGTIKANDRCLFMYDGSGDRYYLIAIDRWGADIDALATVAYTGNYNDLSNKPEIPTTTNQLTNDAGFITAAEVPAAQTNADWNATSGPAKILHKPDLAPVATSGDYNDLNNKPTIPVVPTNISAFVNDRGYLTAIPDSLGGISVESDPIFSSWDKNYNDLTNKPTNATFGQGIVRNKVDNPSGETNITVTFSSYELVNGGVVALAFTRNVPASATLNINNKGAVPIYYHGAVLAADVIKAGDRCLFMYNASAGRYYLLANDRWGADFDALATVAHTGDYNDLINKPALAPVAYSNDYNDLTNKPEVLSYFANDRGYITQDDIPAQVQSNWDENDETSPAYILGKPDMNQYLTDADLSDYLTEADMSNYVTKSEDESIGGDKIFTDNLTVDATGSLEVPSVLNSIGSDGSLNLSGTGDCKQAVNFCDLETLYKKLLDKIDDLQDSIHKLNLPQDGAPCPNTPLVVDYDGNTYSTVRIGNQCWMRENLRVTHWPDGTAISSSSSLSTYGGGRVAGYRYTFNDVMTSTSATATSSITQGICPNGWRVPGNADFEELINYADLKTSNHLNSLKAAYGWGAIASGQNVLGMSIVPNSSTTWADLYSTEKSDWWMSSSTPLRNAGVASDYYGVRCIRSNANGEPNSSPITATPTVETYAPSTAISSISATGATIMPGKITADGGGITQCGMVYSTTVSTASGLKIGETGVSKTTTDLNSTDLELPYDLPSYTLTDFTSGTTVYYRAYATNPKGTTYGSVQNFTTQANPKSCRSVMGNSYPENVEYNGISYPTVAIGTGTSAQCWMAQNLRNYSYADGGSISGYYNPDGSSVTPEYGRLYNWAAALRGTASTTLPVQGVCPTGWHVPSSAEFETMKTQLQSNSAMYCNSSSNIAKALASQSGWYSSSTTCTPGNNMSSNNASGFNAYPAGMKTIGGSYSHYTYSTYFWNTSQGDLKIWCNETAPGTETNVNAETSLSVRCIYGNSAPTVATTTTSVSSSNLGFSNANSISGNVYSNGGTGITNRGIVYSSSTSTPTVSSTGSASSGCSRVSYTPGVGSFTVNLTGLSGSTTYYYRAYASNSTGTTYGEVKSFKTKTNATVCNYTNNNAGHVEDITKTSAKVYCWIYANDDQVTGWGVYLYKKNSSGEFDQVADLYTYSTGEDVSCSNNGYSATISNTPTTTSSGGAGYSVTISGLESGATYKYKAEIARASTGSFVSASAQSNEFTTLYDPVVTMVSVSYPGTGISHTFTGSVTKAGNPAYAERGFLVSSSSSSPTINNYDYKFTASGTGTGQFTYSVGWDAPNSTKYVRAYVKVGSSYFYSSNYKSFTTPKAPVVSGSGFDDNYVLPHYYSANVNRSSIKLKTNFSSTGGSAITSTGVLYTTNASIVANTPTSSTISTNPADVATKWVKVTASSTSIGQEVTISGLASNTWYHIRSFATNAYGTTYSSWYKSVKTAANCGSNILDQNGNSYGTVKIGSQCWMKSNLKATKYDNTEVFGSGDATEITLKTGTGTGTTNRYRYNPNNNSSNVSNYGYLYNYSAAVGYNLDNNPTGGNMTTSQGRSQGICPRGWHVPTKSELNTLQSSLSTTSNMSAFNWNQLAGWLEYDSDDSSADYSEFGSYLELRGSTVISTNIATGMYISSGPNAYGYSDGVDVRTAMSVRCVQDISY